MLLLRGCVRSLRPTNAPSLRPPSLSGFSFHSLTKYGPLFSLRWSALDLAAKLNIDVERRVKSAGSGGEVKQLPRFGFNTAHLVNTLPELVVLPRKLGKEEEVAALASCKPSVQAEELIAALAPLNSDLVFNSEHCLSVDEDPVDSDFLENLRLLAGTSSEGLSAPQPAFERTVDGAIDDRPSDYSTYMRMCAEQLLHSLVKFGPHRIIDTEGLTAAEVEAYPDLRVETIGVCIAPHKMSDCQLDRVVIDQGGIWRSAKPAMFVQGRGMRAWGRWRPREKFTFIVGWTHKLGNDSGSADLAQMVINGAMAAVQNRQNVVRLLNMHLREQTEKFPALAAIPRQELNALAELYVEEKQLSSVIYLFYARGFDWRFFSLHADHHLTRSFQTPVKPKSKTAVYELAVSNATGTLRVDRPDDRAAIIRTLDAFVQQSALQDASTKQIVLEFEPWFERWMVEHKYEKGTAVTPVAASNDQAPKTSK